MRKTGSILLSLCLILVCFTACAKGPAVGKYSSAPAMVAVWYSLPPALEGELLKRFRYINEKYPELKVKGVNIPAKDFVTKARNLQAGGQGPEIFIASRPIIASLYEVGAVSPVLADHAEVFPNLVAAFTFNRQAFALPWLTDVPLLYYRKDTVAKQPGSLDEIWPKEKILVKSLDPLLFVPWWKAQGGVFTRSSLPAMDDPANIQFLTELLELISKEKILVEPEALRKFSVGEQNYLLSWASESIALSKAQVNWSCLAWPNLMGTKAAAILENTYGIANSSIKTVPQLESAIRLVEEELLKPEAVAVMQKATGYLPANVNVYIDAKDGTLLKEAKTAIEKSWNLEGYALEWKLLPIQREAWRNIADPKDIAPQLANAQAEALRIGK